MSTTCASAAGQTIILALGGQQPLRRIGDQAAKSPQALERLFADVPALDAEVATFAQEWRGKVASIGIATLMARMAGTAGFNPVAFLRVLGASVAEHPAEWSTAVEQNPTLRTDAERLARDIREALARPSLQAAA